MYYTKKIPFLFVFIFICLSVSPVAWAEERSVQEEYDVLVKQSYDMPEDYDFQRLRDLFRKLPSYDPYRTHPVRNFKKIDKTIDTNPAEAKKMLETYIETHFAMPEAHFRAVASYEAFKDEEKARYHERMARGLMKALYRSGDGKGPETAIDVIVISEEYLIARNLIKKEGMHQSLKNVDKKIYDVLEGQHAKTGENIELWFHITHIFEKGP